jgi:hypothetical protein
MTGGQSKEPRKEIRNIDRVDEMKDQSKDSSGNGNRDGHSEGAYLLLCEGTHVCDVNLERLNAHLGAPTIYPRSQEAPNEDAFIVPLARRVASTISEKFYAAASRW